MQQIRNGLARVESQRSMLSRDPKIADVLKKM